MLLLRHRLRLPLVCTCVCVGSVRAPAQRSLEEWLGFSSMLARLPIETFRSTIASYMERLDKLEKEEGKE